MSLLMLNLLLMLAGPFAVVLPLAAVARREFAPRRRTPRFRPAFRVPTLRIEVAWS